MKRSSHVSRTPRRRQGVRLTASERDLCDVDVVHLAAVKAALAAMPSDVVISHAAELLGLLGNQTRLSILLALSARRTDQAEELCVCDLAVVARASKSMTSHQLRLLRTSGLVLQRRAGKLTYYRLTEGLVSPLLNAALSIAMRGDSKFVSSNRERPTGAVPRGA